MKNKLIEVRPEMNCDDLLGHYSIKSKIYDELIEGDIVRCFARNGKRAKFTVSEYSGDLVLKIEQKYLKLLWILPEFERLLQ